MNKLVFAKKNASKYQFDLTIHHLMKLPKQGIVLYVAWKRGRKYTGETKKALVKDKTAVWEADFSFKSTLFQQGNGFKKKNLNLYIHEGVTNAGKKGKIGEVTINLGEFANIQTGEFNSTRTISVKLWSTTEVQLKITLKSKLLKKGEEGFTENTTMTDATDNSDVDDDDGDRSSPISKKSMKNTTTSTAMKNTKHSEASEDEFADEMSDDSSSSLSKSSSLSSSSKKPTNSLVQKNVNSSTNQKEDLETKRMNLVEKGFHKKIIGTATVDTTLSDDEEDTSSSRRNINSDKRMTEDSPGSDNTREYFKKMLSSRERRRKNLSLSLDDNSEDFLDSILNDTPRKNQTKMINVDDSNLKTAMNTISKQENELKQLKLKLAEKEKTEAQKMLLEVVITNMEPVFHQGLPISAPVIFKALQFWDCFNPSKKDYLKRVYNELEQVILKYATDNDMLAYWLSNTLLFLNLIQKEFPVTIDEEAEHQHNTTTVTMIEIPDLLNLEQPQQDFIRLFKIDDATLRTFIYSSKDGDDYSFESPVTQFRNDIQFLMLKTYCLLLRNLYASIAPLLLPSFFGIKYNPTQRPTSVESIIKILKKWLTIFKEQNVFAVTCGDFFSQVLHFIDALIFNMVLQPSSKFCSMGFAIQMKMASTALEQWADDNEPTKVAREQLYHLRQVSNVLIMNKSSMVDVNTRKDVCPDLNITQVKQLLINYRADEYDMEQVPSSVIKALTVTNEDVASSSSPPISSYSYNSNTTGSVRKKKKTQMEEEKREEVAIIPPKTTPPIDHPLLLEHKAVLKPHLHLDMEVPSWKNLGQYAPATLKNKPEFAFLVK